MFLKNKLSRTLPPPFSFRQMIYRNEGHLKCRFLEYEINFSDRVTVNLGLLTHPPPSLCSSGLLDRSFRCQTESEGACAGNHVTVLP